MWFNGMMNSSNPPANSNLDDDPQDIPFYGEDPEGRAPLDNNVEVSPAKLCQQ